MMHLSQARVNACACLFADPHCRGRLSCSVFLFLFRLRTCGLTSRSVQFLTSALKLNPFYLTELHLVGNRLENSEIRALAELTKNHKYALRTIE